MYRIKPDADNSFIIYLFDGQPIIRLEGGFSQVIILTFENMSSLGEHRGNDYMAGVVAGCMHMQMLRPDAFNVIKHLPDDEIGPDPRLLEGG